MGATLSSLDSRNGLLSATDLPDHELPSATNYHGVPPDHVHRQLTTATSNNIELALIERPRNNVFSMTERAAYVVYQVTCDTIYTASSWVAYTVDSVRDLFITPEYNKENVSEAISKLQETLDFLDAKINSMTASIEKYTSEAKRLYLCHNRTGAIHQLRLKKMYEREVMKMDSLKFNLESNILHMESVGVMMETVSTIKNTSHQFQIVSKHVDFTKLEDTIEEMFEQRDTSRDIESILQGMHDSHEYDENDLISELEQIAARDDDNNNSNGNRGSEVGENQPSVCKPTSSNTTTADAAAAPENETPQPFVFPDVPSNNDIQVHEQYDDREQDEDSRLSSAAAASFVQ